MSIEIPERTKQAIDRYVEDHIQPGHFLTAVLSNNLLLSVCYGDNENQACLSEIVKYLYNNAPQGCWGTVENYERWIGGSK